MRKLCDQEIIIVPGPNAPEIASDPTVVAAALVAERRGDPAPVQFDEYGPVFYYSPERRLRSIRSGEIRENLGAQMTLVDSDDDRPDRTLVWGSLIWGGAFLLGLCFVAAIGLAIWGLHALLTRGHL